MSQVVEAEASKALGPSAAIVSVRRAGLRVWHRALLVLLVVLGFTLVPAGVARAHAAFLSSEPEPGQELGSAPGVVVLRFSEPLIVKLSRAVVVAPDGTKFEGRPTGRNQIRVTLQTNAVGVYRVDWKTVSPVDGHTLRGSFRFGVGVGPGGEEEAAVGASPQSTDLLIAVARTLEYVGLLLAVGMLLVRRLARRPPPLPWVRARLRLALALALGGGLAVVSGEALVASEAASPGAVVDYITSGLPGLARLIRLGLEALALAGAWLGSPSLWLFVSGAIAALASAGHAAAARPAWWAITADTVHLLAGGLWAGGILALATVRPPSGWRGPEGRELLDRFSPVAVPAFVVSAGFGAIRALQELGTLGDLFGSSYGQVLIAKVALVALMVPLSIFAWRRLRPVPRVEGGIAVLVVGVAALLAAYPLPPGRLAEAEEARERAAVSSALPREGDFTLGDHAGQVLVGLTLRPAQPGPNDALVYLLPLEGEEEAGSLVAELELGDESFPLRRCGSTCRRTSLELAGGEELAVVVKVSKGGRAVFRLPELPAPDGSDQLGQMQERIHQLDSYRLDEILATGLTSIRTRYEFQAPDRMRARLSTGPESIFIGDTRYRREGEGKPWEVSTGAPPLKVPAFTWDFFQPFQNIHVLDEDRIDGTEATVVSFFGRAGATPVWFRVWITSDDMVTRAEMRAIGHFMDHRYFDFDQPLQIDPPPEA